MTKMAALEKARIMARRAARRDGWLEPLFEKGDPVKSFDDFQDRHRTCWEGTDSFILSYGRPIIELASQVYSRLNDEDAWINFCVELQDAFWTEWEEKVNLLGVWEKGKEENVKKKAKTKRSRHTNSNPG